MRPALTARRRSSGVCFPQGFLGAGVAAGIKRSGRNDIALVLSEKLCPVAGTFTTNRLKAAPVLFDLRRIRLGLVRGIVVNSGNANACTGATGLRNTVAMSELASRITARLGWSHGKRAFLVCSTGRIGRQLPMEKVTRGIHQAAAALSRDGRSAAEAIMTTDTCVKQVATEIHLDGRPVRIGGMAKGAGMIYPNMNSSGKPPTRHATMLCVLTTDAAMQKNLMQACLDRAVGQSFNRITVDGDTSTNDTVLFLANGLAGNRALRTGSANHRRFQEALNEVTRSLALMIVQDGEGTSRVVTLEVQGARSAADAEQAARAIGNSILVKCSWGGGDPNWGRIWDAIGYSGAHFDPARFSLCYNGIPLVRNGLQLDNQLRVVHRIVLRSSFTITCNLGLGKHQATFYTTDLTEKYVELNKAE